MEADEWGIKSGDHSWSHSASSKSSSSSYEKVVDRPEQEALRKSAITRTVGGHGIPDLPMTGPLMDLFEQIGLTDEDLKNGTSKQKSEAFFAQLPQETPQQRVIDSVTP